MTSEEKEIIVNAVLDELKNAGVEINQTEVKESLNGVEHLLGIDNNAMVRVLPSFKTINNESIVGIGNITISGGGDGEVSPELEAQVNVNTNNITQNTSDIEKLMKEIYPVTVSFSITPSDTKEYGTTVNTVKASWSITSKGVSPEVEALKIKSNSNSDGWKTIDDVTTRNYTFEDQNITDKATITLYVKIKNETKARETSRDISFAYRGYIGDVGANFSVATGTIRTLLYPSENSTAQFLSTTKSGTYESLGALSNRRIIYVYPKDKGDITSFIDGNGYDVKSLFTKKTVDVLSLNNRTITYNVYISEITTTEAKVTVNFS